MAAQLDTVLAQGCVYETGALRCLQTRQFGTSDAGRPERREGGVCAAGDRVFRDTSRGCKEARDELVAARLVGCDRDDEAAQRVLGDHFGHGGGVWLQSTHCRPVCDRDQQVAEDARGDRGVDPCPESGLERVRGSAGCLSAFKMPNVRSSSRHTAPMRLEPVREGVTGTGTRCGTWGRATYAE